TPEQVPSGEAASFANGKGKKLYIAYQERLKTLNAADFGDLLLENIRLFRQNADVLRSFQERFRFILVDEYQDTNVAQYLWLKLLAQTPPVSTAVIPGRSEESTTTTEPMDSTFALSARSGTTQARKPKNICCVGDDDQSIYGWRGAEVDNI